MARRRGPEDIHELLQAYQAKATEEDRTHLKLLADTISAQETPERFSLRALQAPGGALPLLDAMLDTIHAAPTRVKNRPLGVMRRLLAHLRDAFLIDLDEEALPRDIPDISLRRLDMLKYLHTPKTRAQLLSRYIISERTLRDDLNALEMGWELLGSTVRIQREDRGGAISYNSTAHPLLLMLNLTEVYALAAGFPQTAKGSVFEDMAAYLSRAIQSQLSDYALGVLDGASSGAAGGVEPRGMHHYRPERDMLAQSRQSWLIYMSKRAQRCRVHYADGRGGTAVAEGELSVSLRDAGRLLISGHPEEIPLERVIVFEPLDEYV